jgi:hypothetical protein
VNSESEKRPELQPGYGQKKKLVPLNPTDEMIKAAAWQPLPSYEGQEFTMGYDIVSESDIRVIWAAMLAAAPKSRAKP